MRKTIKLVYCVLFALIIILPMLFLNTQKNYKSDIDNKTLAEFPSFGNNFNVGFEQYIKDRIGFRNKMIKSYDLLNDSLFNELTHPTYTYGRNGYIFFNMHNNREYNSFHKTFAETVLKIQQYVEDRGSHFYYVFEPEKISVYREYLPKGVNYNDDWVNDLMNYMDELGINYVNYTDVLRERALSEQVFNIQYDAGHWNDLGEFYATNMLFERIHQDIPAVSPLQKDQFEIKSSNISHLTNSEFTIKESVPNFVLKQSYDDISKSWSSIINRNPSYQHFHYYVNTSEDAENLPKILIFQGSYYNRKSTFFVPVSSESIGVHNYQNVLDIDYYFNIFLPDVVILDSAEYVLTNTYFNQSKMKSLNLNPALNLQDDWKTVEFNTRINIEKGDLLDVISVDIPLKNVEYAWISDGNIVLDLKKDGDGTYSISTTHGIIDDNKLYKIYIATTNGEKYVIVNKIRPMTDLVSEMNYSQNAGLIGKSIIFETFIDDNVFNEMDVQLYGSDHKTFISQINRTKTTGEVSFVYTHVSDTGLYTIRFKANSNKKDEYAEFGVYLEKGEKYTVSYDLILLEDKKAEISIPSFIGPKAE